VHGYEQDKLQAQLYLYFMNTVKPQDQKNQNLNYTISYYPIFFNACLSVIWLVASPGVNLIEKLEACIYVININHVIENNFHHNSSQQTKIHVVKLCS
jgi:hypothetical protein